MCREPKQAKTVDDLVDLCVGLAKDIKNTRKERLNETGKRCMDVASMCVHAAAQDGFAPLGRGKIGSVEYLREGRQWIKQALDADQKQADQKMKELLERLDGLEESSSIADGLH